MFTGNQILETFSAHDSVSRLLYKVATKIIPEAKNTNFDLLIGYPPVALSTILTESPLYDDKFSDESFLHICRSITIRDVICTSGSSQLIKVLEMI